jgi:hypothetical protein
MVEGLVTGEATDTEDSIVSLRIEVGIGMVIPVLLAINCATILTIGVSTTIIAADTSPGISIPFLLRQKQIMTTTAPTNPPLAAAMACVVFVVVGFMVTPFSLWRPRPAWDSL